MNIKYASVYCTYTSNMYIAVQYLRVYCTGTRRGLSILCFEHCGKRIFSLKNIPDACPVCNLLLTQCDLKIPPFAVPSPFKKAVDFPCSIVIKPTKGNFLLDYSRPRIYQYNEDDFLFQFWFLPSFQTAETHKHLNKEKLPY